MRNFVNTKIALAHAIPCSRDQLNKMLVLLDAPRKRRAGFDVEAWRQFARTQITNPNAMINRQQRGVGSNGQKYEPFISERDKSIIEKNKIQARREVFELDVKMGEYIARDAVNQQIDTANGIVISELRKSLGLELPPRLEGLSAGEIKKKLLAKLDSIFERLPRQFERIGINATA